MFTPSYIETHCTGKLTENIKKAFKILENCRLCPREYEVNRLENEKGIALRGIILRHLVMPGGVAGTREIMRFIAR